MRILGIDPGLATIGIGIVARDGAGKQRAEDWLTITTPAGLPLPERLQEIQRDLDEFLHANPVDLAVVERLFFAVNEQSALDVAQARGVLVCALARRGIPVIEPTPLQMKLAITGDGKADKRQVQTMIVRLLGLQEIPRPDDAADALALALYGALIHGSPLIAAAQPPAAPPRPTRARRTTRAARASR
ncbi:MAG: crossover junction endodeoxyribonuclease RuvC [Candidatus Peregrinibacteria bacterium Gr01-1014_25]|nr:MAG: crossover junction endodeoxyribonuclease RuvC [Candidatus Peregrinibacteria bacterium Gr01-1014_25]